MLPRWTTYPALATVAALLVTAVPEPVTRPAAGAAAKARAGLPVTQHPRLVVLGIDGMDPDILRDVVARYPDRMPHFRRLIEEADGVRDLGTSTPRRARSPGRTSSPDAILAATGSTTSSTGRPRPTVRSRRP